jgi:hypothetical protein
MNRIFSSLLLTFASISMVSAQFQIGANIGMNLPAAGMALPGFTEIDQDGTQHALIATVGAGTNFNASIGYVLHPNIIANLDAGFFKSFAGGFHQYVPNTNSRYDISFAANFTHVTPTLVFQTNPINEKSRIYSRFGFIVGSAKAEITTTPVNVDGLSGNNVLRYSGGTSRGLMGAVGYKRSFGKIDAFVELTTKTITAYPKKLENLENFTGMPKNPTVNFVKTLKPNDDPSSQQLTFALPYSSFGMSIGFIYTISK